jgi:lysophospholipase
MDMGEPISVRKEKLGGGEGIHCRSWHPGDAAGCLVIVHGAAEHSGRYTHIAEYFGNKGLAVYAPDLSGLGLSSGVRGHVNDFMEYLNDAALALEKAKAEYPTRPLFLLGHSMGGTIAALYGIKTQQSVHGIILSSPCLGFNMKVSRLQRSLLRLSARLFPRKMVASGIDPSWVCHDPEVVKKYIEDPLVNTDVSLSWMAAFDAAVWEAGTRAAEFNYPLLVMQAGADLLVDAAKTRDFFERADSEDKSFRLWEGYYHEIMNEPGNQPVLAEIWEWLAARL